MYLIILILEVILFLCGLFISLKKAPLKDNNREIPKVLRMMLTINLSLLAIIIFLDRNLSFYNYRMFVFIGMIFSTLGDFAMAGILKSKNKFILGMSLFAVTHFFYISAYISMFSLTQNLKIVFITFLCFYLIIYIIFKSFILSGKKSAFQLAAMLYGFIIGAMASFSMILFIVNGSPFLLTALGGIIFMSSDMIIALAEIGKHKIKNKGIYVWITYILAQLLIICVPLIK